MRAALLALALNAAPASAQYEGPHLYLGDGEELEVQTRADFNADGYPDLAYIVRRGDEEMRELRVITTVVSDVDIGENLPQVLPLDPTALSGAELSFNGKALLFKELTGGTSAVASTHRFRWNRKMEAMQLIGLDAKLYSRTFAHDGAEASWNLLTGDLVTRTLRLNTGPGDQAYNPSPEKRTKKPSPPVRLENAPSGDDLLGWPGGE